VSGGVQAEQGFRLKNCLHPEVAEFAADAVSSNAVPLQAVRSEMSSGRRLDFSDGKHDASDLGGCVDLRPVPASRT